MNIFLLYLLLFLLGSMIGYVLEVLFRRYVSAKRWVNPGFMRGPWLPLYGFGTILMFTIGYAFYFGLPSSIPLYNPSDMMGTGRASGPVWGDLIPILVIGVSMTLLELLAGLIFVKGFHVKLWDYSNLKGNFLGIICPEFSLIWLICGTIFYYGINPFLFRFAMVSYDFMFGIHGEVAHFGFIFFMGVTYGIMLVDFISSISLFRRLSEFARRSGLALAYDRMMEERKATNEKRKEDFLSRLPNFLKEEITKPHARSKWGEKIKKMLLIDPSKDDAAANYDENGRPISEEDKTSQK